MYDESLIEFKKLLSLRGESEVVEAVERGYAESGHKGAMREAAEELASKSKSGYVWRIAQPYAWAGEGDKAFEWLEKAYDERDPGMVLLVAPGWDSLRSNPRFQDLLERIGLPQ